MAKSTVFVCHALLLITLLLGAGPSPARAAESEYIERATASPTAYWQSRVLQREPPSLESAITAPHATAPQRFTSARYVRPGSRAPRMRVVSEEEMGPSEPEVIPPGQPVEGTSEASESGDIVGTGMLVEGEPVYEPGTYFYPEGYYPGCFLFGPWVEHLSVFAGAHGFKGPADFGRNGNFGLYEGLNYSAPLGGPWNIGYQVGVRVAHSDFAGHQTLTWFDEDLLSRGSRAQMFLTAGLFHRPDCGRWQWSVLFDWMHDDYYVDSDLLQIRHELSFFLDDAREIGYMGMYGVKDDLLLLPSDPQREGQLRYLDLSVLDRYVFFYRRHFCHGGEGRLWAGVSGYGDGLIGADVTLPLDWSWALEASFAYLAPNTGRGADGQMDESWSLTLGLVWYPGRPVDEALGDLFRSVQGVADNTTMMFHGRVR